MMMMTLLINFFEKLPYYLQWLLFFSPRKTTTYLNCLGRSKVSDYLLVFCPGTRKRI